MWLPQDLIEEIIDHISDDTATLKACSLVHRACLDRCRFHLHSSFYYDFDCGPNLPPDLYASPFTARHVRRVHLVMIPDPPMDHRVSKRRLSVTAKRFEEHARTTWSILSRLTNIRHLTLERFECWRSKPHQIAKFSAVFGEIVELNIISAFFKSARDFSQFLSLFRNLEKLQITDVFWPESIEPQILIPWKGQILRHIAIESWPGYDPYVIRDISKWFSQIPPKTLRNLELTWGSGREGLEVFPELMSICGANLKHLRLQIGFGREVYFMALTGLEFLSQLESLTFLSLCHEEKTQFCNGDYSYVSIFLDSLHSENLSSITFQCVPPVRDEGDLSKSLDLSAIDSALSDPSFVTLKKIKFIVHLSTKIYKEEVERCLRNGLPMSYETGKVAVSFEDFKPIPDHMKSMWW
ncbi:hypothetical protein ABKN59_008975 [Abortiporus biennis]